MCPLGCCSWRFAFYFLAFIGGIQALYDVSMHIFIDIYLGIIKRQAHFSINIHFLCEKQSWDSPVKRVPKKPTELVTELLLLSALFLPLKYKQHFLWMCSQKEWLYDMREVWTGYPKQVCLLLFQAHSCDIKVEAFGMNIAHLILHR